MCVLIVLVGIPVDVLHETAKELAKQVQSLAATALISYAHHRGVENLMNAVPASTSSSAATPDPSGGLNLIPDAAIRSVIQEGVKHTVQVAAVHAEITTLATLYLTYLHSRYGSDGKPRAVSSGSSSGGAGQPAATAAAAAISPVAASGVGTPHELSSASRDTLDYDPSGYSGMGGEGTPYVQGSGAGAYSASKQQGRLGPVSHGAREYVSRAQSTNNVLGSPSALAGGSKNVPRYMHPKRAATMGGGNNAAASSATTAVK